MSNGLLIVLSAPSGAGKTTLVDALAQADDKLVVSVSHTTRPRRPTETDGTNYHFVDADVFQRMVSAGEFLEHAQVFGHCYGTSKAAVQSQQDQGRDVILEIDWQGGLQILRSNPDAVGVFVLPPARTTLLERLNRRGQDSDNVIAGRTAAAIEEMSHYSSYDYVVVNDDFETAKAQIQAIITAERLTTPRQAVRLKALIDSLLSPT